jgi:hypothetical protein
MLMKNKNEEKKPGDFVECILCDQMSDSSREIRYKRKGERCLYFILQTGKFSTFVIQPLTSAAVRCEESMNGISEEIIITRGEIQGDYYKHLSPREDVNEK